MSTLVKPHVPDDPEPSPDDDLTGVRALLSSLPEPDPMPEHLVRRINASLAAEHAQRAAGLSGVPITALVSSARPASARRRQRLLFGMAAAAAAVALVAAIGTNLLNNNQGASTAARSDAAETSSSRDAGGAQGPSAGKAPAAARHAPNPPVVQVSLSGRRYLRADFVVQAQTLGRTQPNSQAPSSVDFAPTTAGLQECLQVIGAAGADAVRADVAYYDGQPAMIIVATTNGRHVAYVVRPTCSYAGSAILRQATPLS